MKSLNDVLWNKDGEIGEEGKNNEYQPMGEPPMLTDNCACQYVGCGLFESGVYAGGCI
ncbi:hypothetical protein [uncultured Tissierella sp.]|uniref:hypothetical protein n=1 Tax=uncultured Tissierella sp. TaxID=448160 RepID=UPI0028053149|nr:hypothetical protein [uncultured Tissierella sp.]MDU5083562.1 hypothetical protein [Bacillota bacterium]